MPMSFWLSSVLSLSRAFTLNCLPASTASRSTPAISPSSENTTVPCFFMFVFFSFSDESGSSLLSLSPAPAVVLSTMTAPWPSGAVLWEPSTCSKVAEFVPGRSSMPGAVLASAPPPVFDGGRDAGNEDDESASATPVCFAAFRVVSLGMSPSSDACSARLKARWISSSMISSRISSERVLPTPISVCPDWNCPLRDDRRFRLCTAVEYPARPLEPPAAVAAAPPFSTSPDSALFPFTTSTLLLLPAATAPGAPPLATAPEIASSISRCMSSMCSCVLRRARMWNARQPKFAPSTPRIRKSASKTSESKGDLARS
mmetsp:Transcript_9405/g.23075  ORF Transcript_9405/g.23075 Transcript_9405/m.23075 type:complete len:315 (-) Transcript_9405:469-1413(-)